MKKATAATLCLHKDDRELWDMLEIQCQALEFRIFRFHRPTIGWQTKKQSKSGGFALSPFTRQGTRQDP